MDRAKEQMFPPLVDSRPEVERIRSLTASRDVETVKKAILEKYGIVVHDYYARDLIAFVEALTDGQ